MREDKKRMSTAFGVAVGVHVLAALVIGIFGYRFVTRPPEVLEVALVGGGGGPEEVVEEQVEDNSILRSIDDIIDKKLKPEKKKVKVVKEIKPNAKPSANPSAKSSPSTTPGDGSGGEGSGSGGGSGSGQGTGSGAGAGEGRGVPVTPPRVTSSVQPKYPSSARNAGIEGVTFVKMLVGADGRVQEAFVVKSSGHSELDDAAVNAVYKWRFSPAKDKFNQKAACYVTQGIRFDLKR